MRKQWHNRPHLRWAGLIALLFSVFATPAFGQTSKATIVGTVTDTSGAVVAGATVTVTNVGTNQERTVTTNEDGTYNVPLLDIGVYRIKVTASGFQESVRENITLQI